MKKYEFVMMVLVLALVIVVQSQVGQPSIFYGTITRDGQPAPIGTVISAWINGVDHVMDYTTTKKGEYDAIPVTGGQSGDTVQFKINGFDATPVAIYNPDLPQKIDLICTNCNNPPVLSNGSVSPETGDSETVFTYTVIYSDQDNDFPISVSVRIDNNTYDMDGSYEEPGTPDYYKNGIQYSYSTTLPDGSHTYQFIASDNFSSSQTSTELGPFVGVTTTTIPECTGDTNNDGVVGDFELLDLIKEWARGLVDDFYLLEAIKNWALGCP